MAEMPRIEARKELASRSRIADVARLDVVADETIECAEHLAEHAPALLDRRDDGAQTIEDSEKLLEQAEGARQRAARRSLGSSTLHLH
eukprot:949853-Prymnesium_polylepis.1